MEVCVYAAGDKMKYKVRFIIQGVQQARRFNTPDEAKRFYNLLKASPEVDQVFSPEFD